MGIKIGICGTGVFANGFIPLFKAHPDVEKVALCDLNAEKLKEKCEKFEIADSYPSLDALCKSDVDAIVIITQHHLHGPQAVQALKAGKHVYSAVPSAISMEEITELVKTVEETGQIYMIGETSYYYPCAIFCRDKFQKGEFGNIVYSEGEYMHDYFHGMYNVAKNRYGDKWQQYFGMPPLFYPTHSTSMIVSVTGAHVTHVSSMGIPDYRVDTFPPTSEHERQYREDNLYAREDNAWKNPFSNETMLCKMSDGSVARINEFRRIGHPGECRMSMFGSEASYEEQYNSKIWVTVEKKRYEELSELLNAREDKAIIHSNDEKDIGGDILLSTAKIHPVHILPKEFHGLPNGHHGSHQFLVNDFIKACVSGKTPPNNVWDAARYLVPGLIAHESALKGGVLMEVPDFGDPR